MRYDVRPLEMRQLRLRGSGICHGQNVAGVLMQVMWAPEPVSVYCYQQAIVVWRQVPTECRVSDAHPKLPLWTGGTVWVSALRELGRYSFSQGQTVIAAERKWVKINPCFI